MIDLQTKIEKKISNENRDYKLIKTTLHFIDDFYIENELIFD